MKGQSGGERANRTSALSPRHAALRVDRATPPLIPRCSKPPEGSGALVGPPCGSRTHHHSSPSRCSQAHPCFSGYALAPLRLFAPSGGGCVGFAAARRPRAKERLQNNDGVIPISPWRRACCPAAGIPPVQRDHPFHRGYFWQTAAVHYATGQRNPSRHGRNTFTAFDSIVTFNQFSWIVRDRC